MSISGLLLGLINIAIVVAVLVLVGYIILWLMGAIGFPLPGPVQKIYMVIVALIALYMIVALLLGIGHPFRIIGGSPPAIAWAHA
jgi:hypothetical protein